MLHGIDCSQYQGSINWDSLKKQTDFAIIKCTGGCPDPGQSDASYLDPYFTRNRDEARRVGILHGFYHYAYPEYNSPTAEADYVARVLEDIQPGEIVCLDWEEPYNGDAVSWVKSFLDDLSGKLGFKPLIYMSASRTKVGDWSKVINGDYGLWIAQWTYSDNGVYDYTNPWPNGAAIHQYSNQGSLSAIPGRVDLDVFLGSADNFKAYGKQDTAAAQAAAQAAADKAAADAAAAKAQADAAAAAQAKAEADLKAQQDAVAAKEAQDKADAEKAAQNAPKQPTATLWDWVVAILNKISDFLKSYKKE